MNLSHCCAALFLAGRVFIGQRKRRRSDGAWTLTGVAPGTHNMVREKPGFGMSKRVAMKFPGGQIKNVKAWVAEQPKRYA